MSLPPLDLTLPTDQLRILPWPDPVIDDQGHELRSGYVERFWLPILGPTTLFFLRRVAAGLDESPEGFDLPVLDTARGLGLGVRGGRNAPFLRAIARSMTFNISRFDGERTLEVRRHLAPLNRTKVERLPPQLQDEHTTWQRESARHPTVEQHRRRARRLALSLAELGEADESIEHQLHRWGLHPALAHDALRWARDRQTTPAALVAADLPRPSAVRPIPPPPPVAPGAAARSGRPSPSWPPASPPPPNRSIAPARGTSLPPTGDAA
ncbi:hypothetical protein KSP35_00440 [Aquihabitans sp. G128]|uniref:hypothetical protein n=1 Tax=Aquihabitans sp. G128 TaxID=2849779 RepID=UPI001C24B292|nr:hypothetical protein [Aquihabitans sp. G128]QXC61360.1 hypothetical protein KSP35_00440 [Aquihabitans sp. G128]